MHIPDGFLSPPVWATLDAAAIPAVAWMARRAQGASGSMADDRRIPFLGVMGAFVFAAQMIDFPVGLGTSGHLVGGALLAVLLGPAAASLVMTAIVAIQAFVFQDGGIMALGANVINMAILGVLAGYLPYRFWGAKSRNAAIFAGATLSVLVSASMALSELLFSGVRMPRQMLWVSLGLFLLSALLEGAITVAAIRAIERLQPGVLRAPGRSGSRVLGTVAIAAVLLATVGILMASAAPDGIEKLAAQLNLPVHLTHLVPSPLANYQWNGQGSGFESAWLRKATAGLMGLALIYAACALTGRWLARQRSA